MDFKGIFISILREDYNYYSFKKTKSDVAYPSFGKFELIKKLVKKGIKCIFYSLNYKDI